MSGLRSAASERDAVLARFSGSLKFATELVPSRLIPRGPDTVLLSRSP